MWWSGRSAGRWDERAAATTGIGPNLSVVIPRREKTDSIVGDLIDEPVFSVDATRPPSGEFAAEWFGLSQSSKGISEYRVHELERAQGPPAIGTCPVRQVFKESAIEYCLPLPRSRHSPGRPRRRRSSSTSTASPSPESARAIASRNLSAFFGERSR